MSVLYPTKGFKSLLCLLVATFLVSCAITPSGPVQPVKSLNDDYEYQWLTLENGLEVLLISDPDTPKAAASLSVMVGSGDNPPDRGGLAHFLEHMLFLGTDKYPDAAEYERFITEHGGNRNAYTSFEETNYFFDINAPHLPEALDRFAQFFISPRFDAQYVEREKNAVEAEYQMGLKSDDRRGLDVLQEVMNQAHPFSQFSVGSLETLADRPGSSIRDELMAFYGRYYAASAMRLVVLGAQPLNELEALAAPLFSQVANSSNVIEEVKEPIFAPGSLPLLVQVQPLATQRELEMSFPIADYRDVYQKNPLSYIGNLIGHEGEGSLLSQLKAEGLAESLGAGAGLGWRGGALFSVSIALTEKGAAQYQRVQQLVFAYLEMLREQGPRGWLYNEQSQLAELGFRYREHGSPMGYVSYLARGMHYYKPRDILRGPYIMDDYDEALLRGLLDRIRPENALVTFNDASVVGDKTSRYYQVPYRRQPLVLAEVRLPEGDAARQAMRLPSPNEFIAEDVALVPLPQSMPTTPEVVLEQQRQKIWFMPDDEFRLPKGATYINFRSSQIGQNPRQTALATLYTALLTDSVNEFTYPARLAGLNFSFYRHAQGISLRVTGYNDKQTLLLERLLADFAQPAFDPRRFVDIRDDIIRDINNSAARRPSHQVMEDLQETLMIGDWGDKAMLAALEAASLSDLKDYVRKFWQGASAEALVYGNYQPEVVSTLSAMLSRIIPDDEPPSLVTPGVLQLAANESVQYVVDIAHDDSVVAWYLQGEGRSWQDRAATALSAQIMTSGFFQELRTEQQLGYVVSAFSWSRLDVPGLVMLVQSPVADAIAVTAAMEKFMGAVESTLNETQFTRHKAALRSEILRPDKNLGERAEFYWQSIALKRFDFSGRQELAAAVQALTFEDWRDYYQRVFLQQRHSLAVIAPGRWQRVPDIGARRVDTAEAIKDGHAVYPLR